MKLLCLHGYGTSADILQFQLSTLKELGDPSWEFVFVDGEIETHAAPGIESFAPPPYHSYLNSFNPDSVDKVHQFIEETIEEHGHFDGAIGFSQGAALILSFLLENAAAGSPLPFQFAVLFSSTVPFAGDVKYAENIISQMDEKDHDKIRNIPFSDLSSLSPLARDSFTASSKAVTATASITEIPYSDFFDKDNLLDLPYVIHPDTISARLPIPVVHVSGKQESALLREVASIAHRFFDKNLSKTVIHAGGHDIPRSPGDVQRVLSAMEWAIETSKLPLV